MPLPRRSVPSGLALNVDKGDTYAAYVQRCQRNRRDPECFMEWLRQQLEYVAAAQRDEQEELARLEQ